MKRLSALLGLNRSRLVVLGVSAGVLTGGYFIFPGLLNTTFSTIGRNIVTPVSTAVGGFFSSSLNKVRSQIVNLGEYWTGWREALPENIKIEWNGTGDFFRVIWEGNKELIVGVKNIVVELSRFLFLTLPEFIREKGIGEAVEYLRHYLRPLKLLFSRPELERLQSEKSRFDQLVKALKNPNFFSSLKSMNGFYIQFKDQISKLNSQQLAELIDIYLEDPDEMGKKLDLIMGYMEEHGDLIKKNFDVNLMMDFVRGENVDRIKARLAASKVSSKLNQIASLFGGDSKYDKSNLSRDKKIDESIENLFVSTVTWWNSIAG